MVSTASSSSACLATTAKRKNSCCWAAKRIRSGWATFAWACRTSCCAMPKSGPVRVPLWCAATRWCSTPRPSDWPKGHASTNSLPNCRASPQKTAPWSGWESPYAYSWRVRNFSATRRSLPKHCRPKRWSTSRRTTRPTTWKSERVKRTATRTMCST
ncbi:unknown [Prevotella sp. CAG:891]|nr:unknown [Prevotella sp. CAG:891]